MCMTPIFVHTCGHEVKSSVVNKCTDYYKKEEKAKNSIRRTLGFAPNDCGRLKYCRVEQNDFCSRRCPVALRADRELGRIEKESWQRVESARREMEKQKKKDDMELERRQREASRRAQASSREYERNKQKEEEALRRQRQERAQREVEAIRRREGKPTIKPMLETARGYPTDFRMPDDRSSRSTSQSSGATTPRAPPRLADRPLHPNASLPPDSPKPRLSNPDGIHANLSPQGSYYSQGAAPNEARMPPAANSSAHVGSRSRHDGPLPVPHNVSTTADRRLRTQVARASQVRPSPQSWTPPAIQNAARRPAVVSDPTIPQPSRAVLGNVEPPGPPDPRSQPGQIRQRPVENQAYAANSRQKRTNSVQGTGSQYPPQRPPVPPKAEHRPPVPLKDPRAQQPAVLPPETNYRPPVPPKIPLQESHPNAAPAPRGVPRTPGETLQPQYGAMDPAHMPAPLFSNRQANRPKKVSPHRAEASQRTTTARPAGPSVVEDYRLNPIFAARREARKRASKQEDNHPPPAQAARLYPESGDVRAQPRQQPQPPQVPSQKQQRRGRPELRIDTREAQAAAPRHVPAPPRPAATAQPERKKRGFLSRLLKSPRRAKSVEWVCQEAARVERGATRSY